MFDKETDWGQIHFSRDIVRQICVDAVNSCRGKVAVHEFRGRGRGKGEAIFQQKRGRTGFDGIHVEGDDDALQISVYIVIGFGVSIRNTAEHIIGSIFDDLKEIFEIVPAKVTVINTGTASRDIIARHMEFVRTSDSEEVVEV